MKNKSLKYGFLSLGVYTAILLVPSMAQAEEATDNGLLGVEVNLLEKQDSNPSLLNVELTNVPVIGDVKVNVPSNLGRNEEGNPKDALASVNVQDGIVENADISVLGTSESESESKSSVATVQVNSDLTGNLELDVASSEKDESEGSSSYDGGLVEVNAEDLPILGETHVGVLDEHVTTSEADSTVSGGLVQADLDKGLLEDTAMKVLAGEQSTSKEGQSDMSAVADVHVGGGVLEGIVDELDDSVLKGTESTDTDSVAAKDSLVSIGMESDLMNDVNIDVGSEDFRKDENSYSYDSGLVELNAEDLPILGETHVGVLDEHVTGSENASSVSGGLVQADLDKGLLEETAVKVLAGEQSTTAEGDSNMSAAADVHVGGGVLEGIVDEVNVSVLKATESTDTDSMTAKDSLVSVGLQSNLTNGVNVDVASGDFRADGNSYSYDGGLVEVNAEDLPILGQTHVGVLDEHVTAEGEDFSSSSSLAQVGLTDGLLDGTALDVLKNEVQTTDAGVLETNTGLGLELGLPILDTVKVEVLKTQRLTPFASEDDVTEPGDTTNPEEGTPNPGEDATNPGNGTPTPGENPNNPGNGSTNPGEVPTNPGTPNTEDNPGNSGSGAINPGEDLTKPGDGTITPGEGSINPGNDATSPEEEPNKSENGSTAGNDINGPSSGNGSSNPLPDGTSGDDVLPDEDASGAPPLAVGPGGDAGNGPNSTSVEDELATNPGETGQTSNTNDGTSQNDTGLSPVNVGSAANQSLNDSDSKASLPTTGGIWDTNRLLIVAGLLLLAGLLLRLIGNGTIRFGRKSAS
ncbi:hypothetical protein [Sporosarcina sp. Te-1]|uniref:hypothetical protein n=1 Tax=Sporosarcina sp. Te-1 TaxID=2818390 RepID=UPI001A9E0C9A|nr:hypothetical protein [Sporosarcina sp. Te-1]QTD40955.1 hypothetical protein J3U78_19800 [Sporosarcina sp. Te-1]